MPGSRPPNGADAEPLLRVESREELVYLLGPDVQIALVPFGERALRHFMYLERPEGLQLDDAEGFGSYRGIEAGLAHLVNRFGEAAVFIGPPGRRRRPRSLSGRI